MSWFSGRRWVLGSYAISKGYSLTPPMNREHAGADEALCGLGNGADISSDPSISELKSAPNRS